MHTSGLPPKTPQLIAGMAIDFKPHFDASLKQFLTLFFKSRLLAKSSVDPHLMENIYLNLPTGLNIPTNLKAESVNKLESHNAMLSASNINDDNAFEF